MAIIKPHDLTDQLPSGRPVWVHCFNAWKEGKRGKAEAAERRAAGVSSLSVLELVAKNGTRLREFVELIDRFFVPKEWIPSFFNCRILLCDATRVSIDLWFMGIVRFPTIFNINLM
ncbi:hypothetical protein L596_008595 [Steinernema carpocapsae]|uniref:Uncharacterized protein n=1 Tax=Steinernema carpocapsae TaxID=34508 RepID=A0A4U5PD93_STECR|nr:hypothetical protein L596_008595 [Steinernema carpocapsae]